LRPSTHRALEGFEITTGSKILEDRDPFGSTLAALRAYIGQMRLSRRVGRVHRLHLGVAAVTPVAFEIEVVGHGIIGMGEIRAPGEDRLPAPQPSRRSIPLPRVVRPLGPPSCIPWPEDCRIES